MPISRANFSETWRFTEKLIEITFEELVEISQYVKFHNDPIDSFAQLGNKNKNNGRWIII